MGLPYELKPVNIWTDGSTDRTPATSDTAVRSRSPPSAVTTTSTLLTSIAAECRSAVCRLAVKTNVPQANATP